MLAVSRYDDVKALLSDAGMSNTDAARAPGVVVPQDDRFFFFEYDPPLHLPLRRLLRDLLSRQRIERMAPETRALASDLLRPLLRDGGGELVGGFTAPFVGRLMMRITGFPEDDAPQWRAWIRDMIGSGFSFTNQNERGTGFDQCYPDMLEYLDRRISDRAQLADPPDDVLTRVVHGNLDGAPLSPTLQRMILFSIPSAGGNTMGNFINNTFLSLATDAELFERIQRDRSLVPEALEESLRRDSPSMYISRICREPTTLAGADIGGGEKVLLGLASANRDESIYQDPDEFRLDRADQPPHLAFGWGTHTCIGAHVVRQSGVVLFETFLDQVSSIGLEPGATPVPYYSPQGNGLDELRVTLVGNEVDRALGQ
jgi:cytochrome P450